jgi:hypothetical protein
MSDTTSKDHLRGTAVTLGAFGVVVQLLCLLFAGLIIPKFTATFAELEAPLPALTRAILGYGFSLVLIAMSVAAMVAAIFTRGGLRIAVLIAVMALPAVHLLGIVLGLFLPLLGIVERVGGS